MLREVWACGNCGKLGRHDEDRPVESARSDDRRLCKSCDKGLEVMTIKSYHRYVSAICRSEGWPEPVAEIHFSRPRRWAFDLAWPAQWLAVEIQGATYTHGRHTRGRALEDEYEKLNTAQTLGWCVLLVTPRDITTGRLRELLRAFFVRYFPTTIGARTPRAHMKGTP